MLSLISVSEAKEIVANSIRALPPEVMLLLDAAGLVLAEDIFASIDIPAFQQSSMDGYAIRFADKDLALNLRGEMAAGTNENIFINEGETARIFTGAPLPEGADTVVMQEKVVVENGVIKIIDAALQSGINVRDKGAEVKAGSLAMQKGTLLSPAAIGFLAGIGVTKVAAYPAPSVCIIVTGKELQLPGNKLQYGQVYESNSYSLRAALQQAGIKAVTVFQADDDIDILTDLLAASLEKSDLILLTGGVSVGDYDFVVEATKRCSVEQRFHKVKQRPGKPLFFGTKNDKLVFGLPGNPSSVLSCFYNYVLPALNSLSNKTNQLQTVPASLSKPYSKQKGLTHFLKGFYADGMATPLNAQESFRLSSFAGANCLICLEDDRADYEAGEMVNVILLP